LVSLLSGETGTHDPGSGSGLSRRPSIVGWSARWTP
jgi:hypothetical protein